jgi:hypothetical protein
MTSVTKLRYFDRVVFARQLGLTSIPASGGAWAGVIGIVDALVDVALLPFRAALLAEERY